MISRGGRVNQLSSSSSSWSSDTIPYNHPVLVGWMSSLVFQWGGSAPSSCPDGRHGSHHRKRPPPPYGGRGHGPAALGIGEPQQTAYQIQPNPPPAALKCAQNVLYNPLLGYTEDLFSLHLIMANAHGKIRSKRAVSETPQPLFTCQKKHHTCEEIASLADP